MELSCVRDTRTLSSLNIFKHHLLKDLQFPTRYYPLLYWGSLIERQYLTLACDLILVPWNATFFRKNVVHHQPVLFAVHLLKILNIFCTVQALLLCVKSCLPLLHNYLEIEDIVLPIRKKNWLVLNGGISHDDFDTNVMFLQHVQSFISLSNRFC